MNDADPLSPAVAAPARPAALLLQTFGRAQVTELRHAVAQHAQAAGLGGERLDDFVLAVNELITNAVRHGGGQGGLRLWVTETTLYCAVSDTGTGIAPERLDRQGRPEPDAAGGWGLWLARQLSDEMLVSSGTDGTTVQISARISTGINAGQGNEITRQPNEITRQPNEITGEPNEITGQPTGTTDAG